ncbi:MAG: hypothetical protein HYX39_07955 [Bacteroidetes bacterium]|nr:hypothetical protein [Bacteroidota bacterium]
MKNDTTSNPDPKKGINSEPSEEQQLEKKDQPTKNPILTEEEEAEREEVEGNDFKEMEEMDSDEFDSEDVDGDSDFNDKLNYSEQSQITEQPESIKGLEGSVTDVITNQQDNIVNKKGQ